MTVVPPRNSLCLTCVRYRDERGNLTERGGVKEADAHLILRARHDRAAFGEIYDIYLPPVLAFCRAHSTDLDEAEDMTAQTFERALMAIGRYESRGIPFSAWLLRIAANLVIDRSRRQKPVINAGDDPLPEGGIERRSENVPATLVEQWERAGWLLSHVASLPSDQQQAINLRYWEDQSVATVAERMGRTEAAVRQLLHRAIVALRLRVEGEMAANA